MLRPESWAVIATAAVGIAAAIVAFIRTPRAQRMRVLQPSPEQRLAEMPAEARAVLIRADRRRAFRRDLPWLLALLPVAAFAIWLQATEGNHCATLFGIGRLRLVVASLYSLPPLFVALALLQGARQAISTLRGGYWPPLETAVYTDTIAIAGRQARLRAVGWLVLAAAALATLSYGYVTAGQFLASDKFQDRVAAKEAACAAKP